MIYSQWNADGGYTYYATGDRRALGADLPTPRLPTTSEIGVASTEIGRALPPGAQRVGSGPMARGQIVPMSRAGVLGAVNFAMTDLALLGLAVIFGWWLRGAIAREYSR